MLRFPRRPPPDRARESAQTDARLQKERAEAPGILDPLLQNTPRADWSRLVELPELQTCGTLERLGNLFAESLTKDAGHAKAIAELAVSLSEALPAASYPAVIIGQLRAHAWKDLGKAFRFLGNNLDALEAFTTAEAHLGVGRGALSHDLAIVRFNLAASLQEMGRFEESRALLVESKQIFRDHGDTRNTILCGLGEGLLLQRLKRFREAREVYLLLLASTREIQEESLAAIHQAIGFCSIELEDFADAEENLTYAVQLFKKLRQPIHISRVELGRGRLFIRRGEPAKGISHLRLVRLDFLRQSMHEEAGICGLEMVEGHLLLDQADKAEILARTIVSEFTLAGLNTRAITALGYLSEAIAAKEAKPAHVTHVREYIVSLQTSPERDFQRPTLRASDPE